MPSFARRTVPMDSPRRAGRLRFTDVLGRRISQARPFSLALCLSLAVGIVPSGVAFPGPEDFQPSDNTNIARQTSAAQDPKAAGGSGDAPARPNVVLVTLDTTRADYVTPETMPFFWSLARGGVRYARAQTVFSETGPVHASLLTGLLPARHGVLFNAQPFKRRGRLPGAFGKAGYETAAFISAEPLRTQFGFNLGFDTFDDALDPKYRYVNRQRRAQRTMTRTID
ncbi:MAG: alkaline phosphatase family protein, partial [Phycisphaerae bacterium]